MSGMRSSKLDRVSRWDREGKSSLRKGPAGLIFMCNSKTKRDCFHYKVLGLPLAKRDLVEQVVPGTFLFLFDFDVRELHGIYEAVSHGGMNLEPKAFQGLGSYPAQVRFEIHRECLPLSEAVFGDAIKDNYYAHNKFHFELTSDQVSKLIQLFCPIEPPRKRLHVTDMSHVALQAEDRRHSLPVRMEPVNRDPQYILPVQAPGIEGRLPRVDPLLRREPRPLAVEPRLPQVRVLDGQLDQMGLLSQGRMEEVDQLALKYLQPGSSTASSTLDPRVRNAAFSVGEAQRRVLSRQQEVSMQSRALEAEHLRRTALERAVLREQGALHFAPGSDLSISPLAALRSRQAVVAPSPSSRHSIRRRL